MKFPSFSKRKKDSDETPVAKPMPQMTGNEKPASLGKARMQLLLASVILMGVLSLFIFKLMSGYLSQAMERETSIITEQMAARVAAVVEYYSASTALLAKDPEIAALLMVGRPAELRAREESLRYVFPTAINVQLLPPGLVDVDMETSPPLSYAALAQMRAAASSALGAPIEVHLFNTPQQHVNIVRRVMDPAGSGVVGHIMLSLSNDVLLDILTDLQQMNGYLELRQAGAKGTPVVVATYGDPDSRDGSPEQVLPINGSRWEVAYWPAVSVIIFLGSISVWVLGAFLVASVAMVLLILVLFRRLIKALNLDQVSLVTLMKDFRDGRVKREYPCGLVEMLDTNEFMTQLATGAQAPDKSRSVAREQDDEYGGGDAVEVGAENETPEGDMQEGVAADFGSPVRSDNLILEEDPLDIATNNNEVVDVDPTIFRAYDIRGVVNQTLTQDTVRLIGRAIGSEAIQRGRDTIVVGRDGRLSGPQLSHRH
jgi:phosphomannomutase/phosphoglucomutase